MVGPFEPFQGRVARCIRLGLTTVLPFRIPRAGSVMGSAAKGVRGPRYGRRSAAVRAAC